MASDYWGTDVGAWHDGLVWLWEDDVRVAIGTFILRERKQVRRLVRGRGFVTSETKLLVVAVREICISISLVLFLKRGLKLNSVLIRVAPRTLLLIIYFLRYLQQWVLTFSCISAALRTTVNLLQLDFSPFFGVLYNTLYVECMTAREQFHLVASVEAQLIGRLKYIFVWVVVKLICANDGWTNKGALLGILQQLHLLLLISYLLI